ncbi:low temperature requirement protein A [Gordonia malaquae]|uniref:low temperature requirement protein A n=1 Tax=Gordonia malaquae TaxID=410332 RepID=UPI0030EC3E0C
MELLFDLTFVVAVGAAATQFAEMLSEGHILSAVGAFVLAMFAVCAAWISFTWFGSAFDTDDWLYRILTMVQMVGVVVFTLGIRPMFHSLETGELDLRLMVLGYVIMRLSIVVQWWRVAHSARAYSRLARVNIAWTILAQIGWVVIAFASLPNQIALPALLVVGILEMTIPRLSQGPASKLPWHPRHLAERYSLFAIIVLGEGIVGTVASSAGLLGSTAELSWTAETATIVAAGTGLTFGMWWVYFIAPFSDLLEYQRSRGYLFGYGHIPLFIGIAGAGAGLHAAGLYLEGHSHLDEMGTALALILPVALFLTSIYVLYALLIPASDTFHYALVGTTALVLAGAAVMAYLHVPFAAVLLAIVIAPFITAIGYETGGHRHQSETIESLRLNGR